MRELLRPGALFLNHGIVRTARSRGVARKFVKRYVFPDGELQTARDMIERDGAAGFETRDDESLREHYALTLRALGREPGREPASEAIGEIGDERERVWRLYKLGAALGFERGEIGDLPDARGRDGAEHGLPLDRHDTCSSRSPNVICLVSGHRRPPRTRAEGLARYRDAPRQHRLRPGSRYDADEPEGYRAGMARFGKQLGATKTGASLYELPAGQSICPYHYEYGEEEWLIVLEGRPTLRHPSGEDELEPGDTLCFPGARRARTRSPTAPPTASAC